MACSSGEAFRQISTSPATLNTCGHAQLANQPPLSALTASSTRMSSDARPIASRMPRASDLALLPMLACSPAAGMKSQAATYSGTNHPADTRAIEHEHDPNGRDAEAPPRGHARGHAAAQPVGRVTAQRAAVTAPLPQPERAAVPWSPTMVAVPALRMLHGSIIAQIAPGLAIRDIPDATLMPGGRDQGYAGDLPDVRAWPAEPSLSHEHQHSEPGSTHHRHVRPPPEPPFGSDPERPALRRPFQDRMLAGVAAGLARYFGVDPMIVRIAFVVLTVVGGAGIPLYLAGLLLIPEEGSDQSIAGSHHRVPAVPVTVVTTRQ